MNNRYKESVEKENSSTTLQQILQDIQTAFISQLNNAVSLDAMIEYLQSVLLDYNFKHTVDPFIFPEDKKKKEINGYALAVNVLFAVLQNQQSLSIYTRCTACNTKISIDLLAHITQIRTHVPIETRASIATLDIALYHGTQLITAIIFSPLRKISDFNRSALLKVIPNLIEIYLTDRLYRFDSREDYMCDSCTSISGVKIPNSEMLHSDKLMSETIEPINTQAVQQELIATLNSPFPAGEYAGKPLHWLIGFKFNYLIDKLANHDPTNEFRDFLYDIAVKAHSIHFEGLDDLIPLYNYLKK